MPTNFGDHASGDAAGPVQAGDGAAAARIGKVAIAEADGVIDAGAAPRTEAFCFTPGARIATPRGERPVEELVPGDRVITRDNGIQEIAWTGRRDLDGAELQRAPYLHPVLIRAGALGNGLPERDAMLSPNHRILVASDKTSLYFGETEVLVAAKHMTGMDGIDQVAPSQVGYLHLLLSRHEVILSDGAWTESFQPGDTSLAGVARDQHDELMALFPELADPEGIAAFQSARRSLKRHEAKVVVD